MLPGGWLCTGAIDSEPDNSGAIFRDSSTGLASGAALAGADAGSIGVVAVGGADGDHTRC
jgi:hypothetical protein